MTEFAARPVAAPGTFVDMPRHDVAHSRWTKTPTTFGPRGRIVATLLVVAFGPWSLYGGFQIANPFFLWYLLAYIPASIMVLKHVWARVPISDEVNGSAAGGHEFQGRLAWLSRRIVMPPRIVLMLLGLILAGVVIALWLGGGGETRFAVVVVGTIAGVGAVLAWLSGI